MTKKWLGNKSILWSHLTKWRSEVKSLSRVQLFVTPWTVAYKAPLSMEFSRQEYWSGLPFHSPGDLPNPGPLHWRQILYCLSHRGSPYWLVLRLNPWKPWEVREWQRDRERDRQIWSPSQQVSMFMFLHRTFQASFTRTWLNKHWKLNYDYDRIDSETTLERFTSLEVCVYIWNGEKIWNQDL